MEKFAFKDSGLLRLLIPSVKFSVGKGTNYHTVRLLSILQELLVWHALYYLNTDYTIVIAGQMLFEVNSFKIRLCANLDYNLYIIENFSFNLLEERQIQEQPLQ